MIHPKDPLKKKRIFVGFNNAGAVGIFSWTRVLKRRGYLIDFYGIGKEHFDMPVDILLNFSKNNFVSFWQRQLKFFSLLFKYDIWHFNYLECFFFYPLNLLILKLFRKKIILTCRGNDVRDRFDFLPKALLAKTNLKNIPEFYKIQNLYRPFWPRLNQTIRKNFFILLADKVILTGPFLVSSVSHYDKIIPYARENNLQKDKGKLPPRQSKKIVIVHIPSSLMIKGTKIIKKAFVVLKKNHRNCEFKILDNISHKDVLIEMEKADIIIDQILVGWYGGQAVEAMMMGKIVVAYLNRAYFQFVPFTDEIPVWNVSPWSFKKDLEALIKIYSQIKTELSFQSIKFVKKYHSSEKIANQYREIYQQILKP